MAVIEYTCTTRERMHGRTARFVVHPCLVRASVPGDDRKAGL